jgi:hypothetical protein
MWGNALGWCISAVIVALTAGGLFWFDRHVSRVTGATAFVDDADALAAIAFPVPPSVVVAPSETRDAGDVYRVAIELYEQEPHVYERFLLTSESSRDGAKLPAVEQILAGTSCARMTLFTADPDAVLTLGPRPKLAAIRTIGKSANRRGLLLAHEKRFDEAIKYHEAAFALGARLFEERIVLEELLAGFELMSESVGALELAYSASGASSRAAELDEFRRALQQYYQSRIVPVQRIITSIDQNVIEQHAGDIFHIARNAPERVWRVEAIFKLGRYRYNAGRVGDQRAASRALERLRDTDGDPIIRAAAKVARELTIEQYRMLG